ncbi:MAG: transporter substrate-binding domain-containing protein [Myxococcota bacterium]
MRTPASRCSGWPSLRSSVARRAGIAGALVALVLAGGAVEAQTRPLRVGTKETPPFAIKQGDGTWTGLSVELWRGIAEDLGVEYEWVERDLDGLLEGLANGELDLVAAALTATSERERVIDFSHPFYTSGLGIAVPARSARTAPLAALLGSLLSADFLKAVLALAAVLLGAGALVWMFERRRNPEQFGGGPVRGLGHAFWWSAVTMTTVGYGDKAPQTVGGRLVALVWMFASIVLISGFTAAIASSLTAHRLTTGIEGPADLPGRVVATVSQSTSESYLDRIGAEILARNDLLAAVTAVIEGQAEAAVYDAPLLLHLSVTDLPGRIAVLPGTFSRQDYAYGLPTGHPIRERLNRALLSRVHSEVWTSLRERFLGGP